MHLQQLDSLALGFNFLEHSSVNSLLEGLSPLIQRFCLSFVHHSGHYDLNENEEILVSEEHHVFE